MIAALRRELLAVPDKYPGVAHTQGALLLRFIAASLETLNLMERAGVTQNTEDLALFCVLERIQALLVLIRETEQRLQGENQYGG